MTKKDNYDIEITIWNNMITSIYAIYKNGKKMMKCKSDVIQSIKPLSTF